MPEIHVVEDGEGRLRLFEQESPPQVKIPNNYKRWRPLEIPSRENHQRESLPQDVQPEDKVKLIFRSGAQTKGKASDYYWGDDGSRAIIVAYRVIKLEQRPANGGWVDWGDAFDRGENLETVNNIPVGLSRSDLCEVWLRSYSEPQDDIRPAGRWFWTIENENGNDIMRYRVIRRR